MSELKPYYQDDFATIFHGSCDEILPRLPSSSLGLVITSPPYNLCEGMENKGGFRVGHWKSRWTNPLLKNGYSNYADNMPYRDYVEWQRKILKDCFRLLSPTGAIFYNHKPRIVGGVLRHPINLIGDLPLRQIVVWDRNGGFNYSESFYRPSSEWILVIAKSGFRLRNKAASVVGDVWHIPHEQNNNHPAPFPLALPKQILSTTDAKTVLDPFMGSGTTLVAAKAFGIKSIGIEISEKYCRQAVERLRQQSFAFTE